MSSPGTYAGLVAVAWLSYQWYCFRSNLRKVDHIPTYGSDSFVGSYLAAWKFFISGHKIIEEGYKKYRGGVFKVATFETGSRWLIVGAGPEFAEDIRKASDNQLSNEEPPIELMQMDYTLGGGKDMRHRDSEHHVKVMRGPMTKNIGVRFAEVQDEVAASFQDIIPPSDDWSSHPAMDKLLHIVTRTSNRFFVGSPLCRDREYCSAMEKFAVRMMVAAYAITLSPSFIRPITTTFANNNANSTLKIMKSFLGPTIEARINEAASCKGDAIDSDTPRDMITWLTEGAPEHYQTVHDVCFRLLISNFAAIHTTTITLTDVLFHLAAHKEYIQPLREEIEQAIGTHGWTKNAMARLHKLDSFMKEVTRMEGVNNVVATRKTKIPFKFSNGVNVPEGFTIAAASRAQHYDPVLFADPETFDPYRFLPGNEATSADGEGVGAKQQMVAIGINYILFGVGKHACPGRFFAVNEVKAMVGYVLLNYDIKLPSDSNVPPAGIFFGSARTANNKAHILFRKRRV